ncbi:MAG: hypothetical protein K0Q55_3142 [Verrucomicrobia bacterium]|jgi:hypothetical protein|nr:hypothetical protein [Verrucomicrobiota bacterium]
MGLRSQTESSRFRYRKKVKEEAAGLSLKERLQALLQSDPLVNTIIALAITVGFFHGWLKIRFPYTATTFLFDALLCVALTLAFFQKSRGESFIPSGPLGAALKSFYGVCFIYLLLPMGVPAVVGVAAMRGWCFATLMFCLGYRITKSINQVKSYFYVLIGMGLITAAYGLQQTPQAVEQEMEENALFAERYQNTYYVTSKGRQLRIFSTFVSSGAFAGAMAYVAIFALSMATDKKTGKQERLILFLVTLPIAYAMLKSGARSALISFGVGFAVIAWYRRNFLNLILLPATVALALKLVAVTTGGSAGERFQSILNFDEVFSRISIPTQVGWDYMSDGNWLGGGLGRSGHGVPMFLATRLQFNDYESADGDLGRLMIEMGVVGLIAFGAVMYQSLRTVYQSLEKLRDTEVSTVGLASGGCVVMAIISIPSGSPFLAIPMGAIVWFFIGTLQKLTHEYERGTLGGLTVKPVEAPGPVKIFRHRRSK